MSIQYSNTTDYSVATPEAEIECDVVIVGTGAGGGISAEILSAAGLSVIMVEEGPLKTAADFKMDEKKAYAELYQEVAGRQTVDKSIQILQGRSVGGSTTVNWTSSFRTPEQTLLHWQKEHAVEGLSSKQLAPWFDWVEKRLNIEPWAIPLNTNNQLLAKGLDKLGWSHKVIPRNVKGCANLGYCGMGCPLNAKQSMLVSCIPEALNAGARLICRARVEELLMNADKVAGVALTSMNRHGQVKQKNVTRIKARHTVLSAGAIGTPAIMLRSGLERINSNIGGRTFLHPVAATIAVMPEIVNAYSGAPQSVYSDHFLWRDGVAGELGYKIEVPPLHPMLASILLRQHGQQHQSLMKDFAYYQSNLALMRDGFNRDSLGGQVSLDKYGYPQLDYTPDSLLWRGMRHALLSMTEIQFAAGAKSAMPLHMDASPYTSWSQARKGIAQLPAEILRWQIVSAHVMGGASMGTDPAHSVCNSKGRFHQLAQLSIIDGSLLPTSLGVNPQLTIYGIAAKMSAQLALDLGGVLPDSVADLSTD